MDKARLVLEVKDGKKNVFCEYGELKIDLDHLIALSNGTEGVIRIDENALLMDCTIRVQTL